METKKKVLVFIPQFPVLTETFIERELAKLAERNNVDLTIFSIQRGKNRISEVLKDRVHYEKLTFGDLFTFLVFLVKNFSAIFNEFFDFRKDISGTKNIKNGCIRPGLFSQVFTFLKSVGYAQKFLQFKPDLILAHFLSEPSTIVMHISGITGIPYGISAHAKDILVNSEYTRRKVRTAKFISICNKNAFISVLEQSRGLDVSGVNLAYHGVDVEKILEETANKDFRTDRPLILANGRLVEKKGLEYLVEAANSLKEKGFEFVLHIIGSGPLYEKLMDQIDSLNLSNEVKIVGDNKGIPIDEVFLHYKAASIFAFPSIKTEEGDVDGIANVLFEAGIFKVPVVSTDAGSTGELIIDGITGLMVPQRDPASLAEKIEILMKDEGLRKKLGDSLHNKVSENFDLDRNIIELENMLLRS